jgi:hypothetical protein
MNSSPATPTAQATGEEQGDAGTGNTCDSVSRGVAAAAGFYLSSSAADANPKIEEGRLQNGGVRVQKQQYQQLQQMRGGV